MVNLNWGTWIQGAVVSIVSGLLTVLATMATLKECPRGWQLFVIAGVPTLINFFSFIKQTPPPIGAKPIIK